MKGRKRSWNVQNKILKNEKERYRTDIKLKRRIKKLETIEYLRTKGHGVRKSGHGMVTVMEQKRFTVKF